MVSKDITNVVLVVQQDQPSLIKVTKQLEEAGHVVRAYSNGREACTAISSGINYKLGIFDVVCGDIHGEHLLNLSKTKNPEVPVIIYTGYNIPNLPLADELIPKPMNIMTVARKYI